MQAPGESVPAASAAPQSKKGNLTALWEYAVKSAVAHKEIAEHEGVQVMQCWNEADQLQDSQDKSAKFKKSLSMKFGPQKGSSIHELMQKRRDQTIQMLQQKQLQKRQQQQQQEGSGQTVDLTVEGNSSGSSQVPNQAQMPQQGLPPAQIQAQPHLSHVSQVPLQQTNYLYNQQQQQHQPQAGNPLSQPAPFAPQQSQAYMPMGLGMTMGNNQPPGTFNNFSTLPPGSTGFPGQMLNNGSLLTPISNMNGNMMTMGAGGYMNNGLNNNAMNSASVPINNNFVPGGNAMHGVNNMGQPMNSAFHNTNQPNSMNMSQAAMLAMNNANKKPPTAAAKRTAGKAGMDDANDKKPAKKRNPPPAKPFPQGQVQPGQMQIPGQAQGQVQGFNNMQHPGSGNPSMGMVAPGMNTNPNRPLNTPGAPGFYGYTGGVPNSGPGHPGGGMAGSSQQQPHQQQPPTVAQELESMTERINSAQEGIEPAGDNALTAPLALPQDFVRQEADLARERLRLGLSAAVGLNLPGSSVAPGVNRYQPSGIPGNAGGFGAGPGMMSGHPATHEQSLPWQFLNIVDKSMMSRAAAQVLENRDLKIGVPALNALSTGIQLHLKNILEAAYKTSKSRINRTAVNSYEGITRMIVEHGKGHALPENQQNIAIRWGDDVRAALRAEELTARTMLRQYDNALEESLTEKMKAFDEERSKNTNKRKLGDADVPWWNKEDGAEKAGLLGWSDLAMVSFKNSVARKHELGAHAHSMKKNRNSLPAGRTAIKPPGAEEGGGNGSSSSSADAGAKEGESSNAGLTAAQQVLNSMARSAAQAASNAADEATSSTAAEKWSHQPCPLTLPTHRHIMLLEEDLAGTLARSSGSRALPTSGVLSSTRNTGTCLYKWKMGVYTNPSTNT